MHSKQKGNIGFTATVLELQKNEFNVFSEIGDYSRVDIIAEKNGITKKIQVKYDTGDSGSITLNLVKSGPNGYRYTYNKNDVDWFAIYSPKTDKVYWLSVKDVENTKKTFTLRLIPSKNKQKSGIHDASDFGISRLLRDFTQDTCNGDDKVQTTTLVRSVKAEVVG